MADNLDKLDASQMSHSDTKTDHHPTAVSYRRFQDDLATSDVQIGTSEDRKRQTEAYPDSQSLPFSNGSPPARTSRLSYNSDLSMEAVGARPDVNSSVADLRQVT